MCRQIICTTCQKKTWVGCGMHIESALAGVSVPERCAGWERGGSGACKTVEGIDTKQ